MEYDVTLVTDNPNALEAFKAIIKRKGFKRVDAISDGFAFEVPGNPNEFLNYLRKLSSKFVDVEFEVDYGEDLMDFDSGHTIGFKNGKRVKTFLQKVRAGEIEINTAKARTPRRVYRESDR